MKIVIILNGLTHYFNLIVSKINEQPGVEITYVHPKEKSADMGEGVHETKEGVNFKLIALEEKMNHQINSLYYEGLDLILRNIQPDIIMVGEAHVKSLLFDKQLKNIVDQQNIKIVLKSIPFRLKKYEEDIMDGKIQIKNLPAPPFNSIPNRIRPFLKFLKLDLLYKRLVIEKKAVKQLVNRVNERKDIYNLVDAHVNYVQAAYELIGSYNVSKEKIFVTYNSPDTDFYFDIKEKIINEPLPLPANRYRIVHVSRLVEWKRVDMLILAVAHLKQEYPEIELLVIGNGPEKENLRRQAVELNVQDSVIFLGGIYKAELLGQYLMSSSVYTLAGMGGLSINDAMIFGLPVICSVCDGTEKHLVREGYNGLYFEEGNQASLEEKIKLLFNNPELCKEMGKNSVEIIKKEINIHTVVQGYISAFNYVINKN